jgi:UTP--glucose-1-phosphate uridylyltransferase
LVTFHIDLLCNSKYLYPSKVCKASEFGKFGVLILEITVAVVPVAGLGTRLLPATKSQPKEMLPVGRKPVVQYVVEELAHVGMQRILFITGPGKASIENHFDLDTELIQVLRENGKENLLARLDFERAPLQYFYTRQRRQLGLGHAVSCAEPFVGHQPFAVALGDSIIGLKGTSDVLSRMKSCFFEKKAEAVIAFTEVSWDRVPAYGVAKPAEGGDTFRLEDVVEKPDAHEAPSNLVIAARYVFAPGIFEALARIQPGSGGEYQLTDAIRLLIQGGAKVYGVRLTEVERRYDIGNFTSYYQAFVDFALADEKHGPELREYLNMKLRKRHADYP